MKTLFILIGAIGLASCGGISNQDSTATKSKIQTRDCKEFAKEYALEVHSAKESSRPNKNKFETQVTPRGVYLKEQMYHVYIREKGHNDWDGRYWVKMFWDGECRRGDISPLDSHADWP